MLLSNPKSLVQGARRNKVLTKEKTPENNIKYRQNKQHRAASKYTNSI